MPEFGMTYDDQYSIDKGFHVTDVGRPVLPPIKSSTKSVLDSHGVYYFGSQYDAVEIPVEMAWKGKTANKTQEIKRGIAAWLQPKGLKKLIFDDEPDRYYSAVVTGDSDVENLARIGQGEITFLAPDPFAYALTDDVFSDPDGSITFTRKGTAESNPLIEVEGTSGSTEGFTMDLNGTAITFTGSLAAGETLVFDSKLITAYILKTNGDQVSAVNKINSLDFPITLPDINNQLTVTANGSASLTNVKITCRSRWV